MALSTNVDLTHTATDDQTNPPVWSVQIMHIEAGQMYGTLPRAAPRRFQYITLTLAYAYRGAGCATLYPESIALVCFESSPLQGLAQTPLLFLDEDTDRLLWPSEQPITLLLNAGVPHRATLVYEFHEDCRQFRLYFPECDSICIELP